jgi:hypothetical protein
MAIARNPATAGDQGSVVAQFVAATRELQEVRQILAAETIDYVEFLVVVDGDRDDAIGEMEPALTEMRRSGITAFDYHVTEEVPLEVPWQYRSVHSR